jgi:hypothetical protein
MAGTGILNRALLMGVTGCQLLRTPGGWASPKTSLNSFFSCHCQEVRNPTIRTLSCQDLHLIAYPYFYLYLYLSIAMSIYKLFIVENDKHKK